MFRFVRTRNTMNELRHNYLTSLQFQLMRFSKKKILKFKTIWLKRKIPGLKERNEHVKSVPIDSGFFV